MTARRERGFALLVVLWLLTALLLIGHAVVLTGRTETRIAAALTLDATVEAAADGGVAEAIWRVARDDGAAWVPDGRPHRVAIGGVPVEIAITDETAKIPVNTATAALLLALFEELGEPPDRAVLIVDEIDRWRSPRRPDLADETASYRARGLVPPAHAPFSRLDDLAAIDGMTPALLAHAQPFLTAAYDGPIARDRASPVVARLVALNQPAGIEPGAGAQAKLRVLRIEAHGARDRATFLRTAIVRLNSNKPPVILLWSSR